MSEQEKKEAIATTGEVKEAKEPLLKRLWRKPIVKKIVKGAAVTAACVGSFLVGRKTGCPAMVPLPDEGTTDAPDEDDAE